MSDAFEASNGVTVAPLSPEQERMGLYISLDLRDDDEMLNLRIGSAIVRFRVGDLKGWADEAIAERDAAPAERGQAMSDPSVQEALDDVLCITDAAWQNDALLTDDEMEAIASHIATLRAALSDEYRQLAPRVRRDRC